MDEMLKELEKLLSKYKISIDTAVQLYNEKYQQNRRLIQCYENSERIWCYYIPDENNPCKCKSNVYHYEYDRFDKHIYAVCNGCNEDIYTLKDEYVEEKLCTGQWIAKKE